MAIVIQNIDPNPRERGEHLYELRINRLVIAQFTHRREETLASCLAKAAEAARRAQRERQQSELQAVIDALEQRDKEDEE